MQIILLDKVVNLGNLGEIVKVKDKNNKLTWPEPHDYLKGKRRFKSDLVPAPVLVARYFSAERDDIEALDAQLAALEQFAVQTQVYEPEARGGASMSALIIDDEPVLFPKVTRPDIYVIMSQEGFEKYGTEASGNAVMLVDSSLVHSRPSCRCIDVPATREAREVLGRDIVANIIMLGALLAATGVVSREAIEKAILDSVPKGTETLNLKAMKRGFELVEQGVQS